MRCDKIWRLWDAYMGLQDVLCLDYLALGCDDLGLWCTYFTGMLWWHLTYNAQGCGLKELFVLCIWVSSLYGRRSFFY